MLPPQDAARRFEEKVQIFCNDVWVVFERLLLDSRASKPNLGYDISAKTLSAPLRRLNMGNA
jgi:hypothetical protein